MKYERLVVKRRLELSIHLVGWFVKEPEERIEITGNGDVKRKILNIGSEI